MIAPILPGAETLAAYLAGKVDTIRVDCMNYNYANWVYRKYGLEDRLSEEFFERAGREIVSSFSKII